MGVHTNPSNIIGNKNEVLGQQYRDAKEQMAQIAAMQRKPLRLNLDKNIRQLDEEKVLLEKIKDISLEPSEENKIFSTLLVNEQNIVNGNAAWDRAKDAEFKILNDIASILGDNENASGNIKLYTDLDCCPSCRNVILQFMEKYPNIDIKVIYKTKGEKRNVN